MNEKDKEFGTANKKKGEDKEKGYKKKLGNQVGFLGIEGLEPSRFFKSTDFPFPINFIIAGIDM